MRRLRPNSRAWDSSDWQALWAVIMLIGVLAAECDARAQDAPPELPSVSVPCAPEVAANRRAVIQYDGDAGIWFHLEVARCMVGRLAALPLYGQRVSLLEDRLRLGDERTELLRRQVRLAEEGEQHAVSALEAANRARRRAEEDKDAWYRAPALWFAIGVVAAVAIGIGVAYGLDSVTP